MDRLTVRLQPEPFDPGAETNRFLEDTAGAGASVTFTGMVRSTETEPVDRLTLEHYPALAENQLQQIGTKATQRFGLMALTVIHRYGTLHPTEPIVQVMALAPHRQAAFDGAAFVMDWLKTDAPFWKKQSGPDGTKWIEAAKADNTARDRWERD